MKILVTYNNDYKEANLKTFAKGVEFLKKQGHNLKQDVDLRKGKSNTSDSQSKLDKAIRDADIVIAEVTDADAKVGFDIARALAEKKIVIAIHKDGKTSGYIDSVQENNSRSLILASYTDKNIVEVVEKAVEEAKSKLDTKFILIISPEIDRYLDWAGQTKRMHKAQIVRNAIENVMAKDKEYKTFIQG
jgi:hypothetical protein